MKIIIQKVNHASVVINGEKVAAISKGLLIFLGIAINDTQEDIDYLTNKIVNLRIFEDENGTMNHSIITTNGDALVVSQFTLHASTKRGNRPSYIKAAKPEYAEPLYVAFISALSKNLSKPVETGKFGANMNVHLENNGPITIIIDSRDRV